MDSKQYFEEMNSYVQNVRNGIVVLPPIPTNTFESDYFNAILKSLDDEKKEKLEVVKIRLEEKRIKTTTTNIYRINTTVVIGFSILMIGLINLGAGTERSLENIKNILNDFNKNIARFVTLFATTTFKTLYFGRK
jgi:hypothetical protein